MCEARSLVPRLEQVPPFWSKEREQGVPRRPYEETEYCLGFRDGFLEEGAGGQDMQDDGKLGGEEEQACSREGD